MESNPYRTPNSLPKKPVTKNGKFDESTARIWTFEDSHWGVGLKLYNRGIWSIVFVNTFIAFLIISLAPDCQIIYPPIDAACELNGIDFSAYVAYSAISLVPLVFGLLVINWLLRQVIMFVFAFRN